MRIALLFRDTEYMNAFAGYISEYDRDIVIDLICPSDSIEPDALIITDANPADIDPHILEKIAKRTVFLVSETSCNPDVRYHSVFKYSGASRIFAYISEIYFKWSGFKKHSEATSKTIACCTDSDSFSSFICFKLARQIIYRHGGSLMTIPLGYINEQSSEYDRDLNMFARLMYMIRKDSPFDINSFSYIDRYGIRRFMIPSGRNPIAYLESADLTALILKMSTLNDTTILDIGGCYRPENLELINHADHVVCIETGRRRIDFETFKEKAEGRVKIIKLDYDSEEDMEIDEYVRTIYE